MRLPQDIKAHALLGVIEADETYFLRPCKGQHLTGRAKRWRRGNAAKRGLSDEQVLVLVSRWRAASYASPTWLP